MKYVSTGGILWLPITDQEELYALWLASLTENTMLVRINKKPASLCQWFSCLRETERELQSSLRCFVNWKDLVKAWSMTYIRCSKLRNTAKLFDLEKIRSWRYFFREYYCVQLRGTSFRTAHDAAVLLLCALMGIDNLFVKLTTFCWKLVKFAIGQGRFSCRNDTAMLSWDLQKCLEGLRHKRVLRWLSQTWHPTNICLLFSW